MARLFVGACVRVQSVLVGASDISVRGGDQTHMKARNQSVTRKELDLGLTIGTSRAPDSWPRSYIASTDCRHLGLDAIWMGHKLDINTA